MVIAKLNLTRFAVDLQRFMSHESWVMNHESWFMTKADTSEFIKLKRQSLFHCSHSSSYSQTFSSPVHKFRKFSSVMKVSLCPTFLWNILFSFQFLSIYHFRFLLFRNLNDNDFFLDPGHLEVSASLCPKCNLFSAPKTRSQWSPARLDESAQKWTLKR